MFSGRANSISSVDAGAARSRPTATSVRGTRYHLSMRFSRTAVLVLVSCALGLTACGSDEDKSSAITTLPTIPAERTDTTRAPATTPDGTETTPSGDTATGDDGGTPSAGTSGDAAPDADDAVPSGGVSPSNGSGAGKGTAGGEQPTITAGTADEPASAIAPDASTVDLWCEQARRGTYDDQVGEATSLAITVRGSDDTRICELPR